MQQIEGIKYDKDKPRVDLLPTDSLLAVAEVLEHGAAKYGDRNWELGMAHSRLYAATLRHLFAHNECEDYDEESGLPHLAHAACCVLMLLALWMRKHGEDNRVLHT